MTKRVLFVLKYREHPYGTGAWGDTSGNPYLGKHLSSGLFNSASFVNDMLNSIGIESKLVHVLDNNFIHREIVAFNPTHVIIEAFWVVPEKFDELRRVCPNVTFIVRNHSESPFLANEGIAFEWTLKYLEKPNVIMSCNAPRMNEETKALARSKFLPTLRGETTQYKEAMDAQGVSLANFEEWLQNKVVYLPNFYPVFDNRFVRKYKPTDELHVGCFGAIRPLKNHMIQALAAIKLADKNRQKLFFHVNAGRVEGKGEPILKNLRQTFDQLPNHTLVEEPWRPHNEFKQLIAKMDLVSQVTYTETFNIVGADAVTADVPVVVSSAVPWAHPLYTADPNSSDHVQFVYERALWLRRKAPWFNPQLKNIIRSNKVATLIWGKYFTHDVIE